MIKKTKDLPIWLQILIPSLLIILVLNAAGLTYFIIYLRSLGIHETNLSEVSRRILLLQSALFLLTAGIITMAAMKNTRVLSRYVRQKFRNISLLEPAHRNETYLVKGILDEYARVFNEKNGELLETRKQRDQTEKLIEELPLPIINIDLDGNNSFMNPAALAGGIEKIFDRNHRLLAPWRSSLKETILENRAVEWKIEETRFLVSAVKFPEEKGAYLCLKEMNHNEELLDRINNYDLLTNLPNRVLFMEILNRCLKTAERAGETCICILIDIDDLEGVNEAKGYPEGDRLLRQFGRRLKSTIRDEDTAARLSGDEFVILIPRLSREHISLDFLQRIQRDLVKPFTIGGEELTIGISMGISIYPEDGREPNELIKKANTALSRTKKIRRGTFTIFDPEVDTRALRRREMDKELEGATARKEFELYYQPKVETGTEIISGFEALIRWNREVPISPAEFIPLAEETGRIVDIGKFVIEEASRFLNRLSDQGRQDLQVAINISARQFKDPGFEKFLVKTARTHQLDFSKLELEVTEGFAATETTGALAGLANLSAQGFSIAIDDFGTGYSSMNYLQDLSFDTLKIDKSFIDRITSKSGLPIVKAIIALGKSIEKKIVAEGVETHEQLEVLEREGCDVIQGYYYSKPLPADEALKLIETWPDHRKRKL